MLDVSQFGSLTAHLEKIRLGVKNNGARKAVRAGAQVFKDAIEAATPESAGTNLGPSSLKPGEMKANVRIRMTQVGGNPVALIGPKGADTSVAKAAHLVEYGHRMVTGGKSHLGADGVFSGGGTVRAQDVPAHPFFRPAYEASHGAALEAVSATLVQEIQKAAKA